tara:strand:- start:137 stop:853 length:717 start_codon:yes stop_codon:yes gene_type:complete
MADAASDDDDDVSDVSDVSADSDNEDADSDDDDDDVSEVSADNDSDSDDEPRDKKQRLDKYKTEPGTDVLKNEKASLSNSVVLHASDKFTQEEPLPDKPEELTYVNQKIAVLHGETVYVPQAHDATNVPELRFRKVYAVYSKARKQLVRLLGFGTAKVVASWSPGANWHGLFLEKEKLVLINLAIGHTTLGEFESDIIHELAHAKTVGCGHNSEWYTMLEEMNAAFADAKYAANGATR